MRVPVVLSEGPSGPKPKDLASPNQAASFTQAGAAALIGAPASSIAAIAAGTESEPVAASSRPRSPMYMASSSVTFSMSSA